MIALILWKVDWNGLGKVLAGVDLRWAIAGCASTSLLIAGLALRWQIFLRQQRVVLPFGTVFSLTWAGQFFNSLLPGSTGGDVVKIYQICRLAPDRKAAAAASVFVDRLSALVALLVLAGAGLLINPTPLQWLPRPAWPIEVLLLAALLLALCGAAIAWLLMRYLRGTVLHGRIARTIAAARANLAFGPNFIAALLLAFGVHLVNFFIVYLFARALGLSISYAQMAMMMPVVLFLVMAPVTINGHGLREFLLIGYFSQMAVVVLGNPEIGVREAAVALSLLTVASDLLWSVPGGVVYALTFRSANRAA